MSDRIQVLERGTIRKRRWSEVFPGIRHTLVPVFESGRIADRYRQHAARIFAAIVTRNPDFLTQNPCMVQKQEEVEANSLRFEQSIAIERIDGLGFGAITTKSIPRGAYICLAGLVNAGGSESDYAVAPPLNMQTEAHFHWDGATVRNASSFFNHAPDREEARFVAPEEVAEHVFTPAELEDPRCIKYAISRDVAGEVAFANLKLEFIFMKPNKKTVELVPVLRAKEDLPPGTRVMWDYAKGYWARRGEPLLCGRDGKPIDPGSYKSSLTRTPPAPFLPALGAAAAGAAALAAGAGDVAESPHDDARAAAAHPYPDAPALL